MDDGYSRAQHNVRIGISNLQSCFNSGAGPREYLQPAVAEEMIRNCLGWFEGTPLDPATHLDAILKLVGQDRQTLLKLLMRNRDLKEGDTLEIPYAGAHVITAEDLGVPALAK